MVNELLVVSFYVVGMIIRTISRYLKTRIDEKKERYRYGDAQADDRTHSDI